MEKKKYEEQLVELARQNKKEELLSLADQLVEEYPDWHIAWHYLGVAYGFINDHERAVTCFLTALEIKPQSTKAMYGLSVAFHCLQMYSEAVACLKKYCDMKEPGFKIWFSMGVNYSEMNNFQEAYSAFSEAIRIRKDDAAYFCRADAMRELGDLESAVLDYKESLALKPDNILVLHNLAVTYKYQGKIDKAIDYYEKVLAINPDFPRTLQNLGEIFLEKEEMKLAEQYLIKAKSVAENKEEIDSLLEKIQ